MHHDGDCHFYCKNGYRLYGEKNAVKCFDGKFDDKFERPKCVKRKSDL